MREETRCEHPIQGSTGCGASQTQIKNDHLFSEPAVHQGSREHPSSKINIMPKLQTPGTILNSELIREVPQFPRSQGGVTRAGEQACDNRRERTTATAERG